MTIAVKDRGPNGRIGSIQARVSGLLDDASGSGLPGQEQLPRVDRTAQQPKCDGSYSCETSEGKRILSFGERNDGRTGTLRNPLLPGSAQNETRPARKDGCPLVQVKWENEACDCR